MSAGKFTLSLTAAAQMAMMSKSEKDGLNSFFASDTNRTAANTASIGLDRFVSRVGRKRVLWRPTANKKPEIVSIVDEAYADSAQALAAG